MTEQERSELRAAVARADAAERELKELRARFEALEKIADDAQTVVHRANSAGDEQIRELRAEVRGLTGRAERAEARAGELDTQAKRAEARVRELEGAKPKP